MVIALPDRVSERQKQRAENNAIAEREAEKKAEQERIAKVEAAEVAKQARIAAYWDKHPEELKALTEKRAEAEKRLGELTASIFAVEQRKALENVISAINEEISKDREG